MIKDFPEETLFSISEIRNIANRWYFWKGLFIGAIGMLISLLALGLYLS